MHGGRLWLGALLLLGCGDDGGGDTDSSTASGSGSSSTMNPPDSTSAPSTMTTAVDSSSGPSGTSSTGDSGPADSSGSDSTGTPVERGCPDGPFADTPLPSPRVTATAVPDSSSNAHAGGLAEGPVWLDGALYFSHFAGGPTPPGTILRYDPGMPVVPAIMNAGSNGLATDGTDILGVCHDDGSISRFTLDGTRTTVVAGYQGQRFNSPNDLTIRSDGTIYLTDPSYQAPQPQPQPVTGVYRVDLAGDVELIDGSLGQPNGISLSPDESVLYVGTPGGVMRYDVDGNGMVTTPGMPFGSGISGVDGMGMDCAGNLYVTMFGAGEIDVVAPDGTTLGTIVVAPSLTNVAFGGDDMTTLYATAGNPDNGDALYEIELQIPGYPY